MSKITLSSDCSVCFEDYNDYDYPVFLPCGHIICFNCSSRMRPLECPFDHKAYNKSDVKRVLSSGEDRTLKHNAKLISRVNQLDTELNQTLLELERQKAHTCLYELEVERLRKSVKYYKVRTFELSKRTIEMSKALFKK